MSNLPQITTLKHIPGTKFVFRPQNKLGEGYGGQIFEGFNISNSETIAVKILNKNSEVENQISRQEIKQIARKNSGIQTSAQLKPNRLVEIIDIIQLDKTYIIMQLCKCNLKQYLLCKGKLNEFQVLEILKNIVQALVKIEKDGYHFCDLKPQNILITKDNQAKLGDLESLVKLKDLGQNKKQKYRHQIFGTLHYMPPQLIQFGQYGSENYIWTLGVILHQIIYHRPPFNIIPRSQNQSQDQKHRHVAEFYKNLFNIHICTSKLKDFPKSHYLLKNMLRLNQRKRMSLEKLNEFLSEIHQTKQMKEIQNQQRNFQQSFGKVSQATEDNSVTGDITEFQVLEFIKPVEEENKKRDEEIDQNQKQQQNRVFLSQTIRTSNNQTKQEQEQIKAKQEQEQNKDKQMIQIQFFNETFLLINQIHSPLILVKKLDELKLNLKNILNYQTLQNKHNQKVQQSTKIQMCLKFIQESKAFSHLQKTAKYSTSQNDKQRNFKELVLYNHLKQLFNQTNNTFTKTAE